MNTDRITVKQSWHTEKTDSHAGAWPSGAACGAACPAELFSEKIHELEKTPDDATKSEDTGNEHRTATAG